MISTRNPNDIKSLRESLVEFFEREMIDEEIFIKHGTEKIMGEIRNTMRVLKENYENDGVHLRVRSNTETLNRLKQRFGL